MTSPLESVVGSLGGQPGLSQDDAASAIAQVLPGVVDHLMPDSSVSADEHVAGALDALAESASG